MMIGMEDAYQLRFGVLGNTFENDRLSDTVLASSVGGMARVLSTVARMRVVDDQLEIAVSIDGLLVLGVGLLQYDTVFPPFDQGSGMAAYMGIQPNLISMDMIGVYIINEIKLVNECIK